VKLLTILKIYFLKIFTPVQKLMQEIGRDETRITRVQVDKCISSIQEGDILLSYERQRLTSLFIKGFWSHAAIVSSKLTVVEAVKPKVKEVDLEEWLFKKDYVCIIRPLCEEYIRKIASANSLYYIGKDYDYTFSLDNTQIYCSELVYLCYKDYEDFNLGKKDDILPEAYLKTETCKLILDTRSL